MKVLLENDYPCSFICYSYAAMAPREDDGERGEERLPTAHLPYVTLT